MRRAIMVASRASYSITRPRLLVNQQTPTPLSALIKSTTLVQSASGYNMGLHHPLSRPFTSIRPSATSKVVKTENGFVIRHENGKEEPVPPGVEVFTTIAGDYAIKTPSIQPPSESVPSAPAESAEVKEFNQLGDDYVEGKNGKEVDGEKALEMYHIAADMGSVEAIFNIGVVYMLGIAPIEQNHSRAFIEFVKAQEKGCVNPQLYLNMGTLLYKGYGVQQNVTKAMAMFYLAGQYGEADGYFLLARCYKARSDEQTKDKLKTDDLKKAVFFYQQAIGLKCKQPDCYHELGCMYLYEDKLRNIPRGINLLEKAVELGSSEAAVVLGDLFQDGTEGPDGIPKDLDRALFFFRQALQLGKEEGAIYNAIGMLLTEKKEGNTALKMFHRAVESGFPHAWVNIGDLYLRGLGSAPIDPEKALQAYLKAEELNVGPEGLHRRIDAAKEEIEDLNN